MLNEIELTQEQLRQMQLVQLEMLVEVDRICRKYDIKYSLDGGTLLGAVRHNGFIPWDDDIDLIMERAEYEKFYALCEKELDEERFFLQEHRTDPYYCVGYPRLRRKHTTYLRAGHEHMKYQTGIFIDIFVLDGVPDNKLIRPIHRFWCFCLRKMLWAESGKVIHDKAIMRKWYKVLSLISKDWVFNRISGLSKRYSQRQTELVSHLTHPYPSRECLYGIPRNLLNEYTEVIFEGSKFIAVKEYKRYLSMLYGDYMKLPPKEKQRVHIHLAKFGLEQEVLESIMPGLQSTENVGEGD